MGGESEPRVGFRAKARKHFTNFIHSKSPKKELVGGHRDESGNLSNGDSFNSVETEKAFSTGSFERGSRDSTEFDPLKRLDSVNGSLQSCTLDVGGEEPSSPWPEEFICPISKDLMADPVILASGTTYERQNVQVYLQLGYRECFKTGETLEHLLLTKNSALKKAIANWCTSHHQPMPVAPDEETSRKTVERVCGDGVTTSRSTVSVPLTAEQQLVSSDTTSSDSSGGGSSRRSRKGPFIAAVSAVGPAAGTVIPRSGGSNKMRPQPQRIPEASPVDVSTSELSHSAEWQSTRERMIEPRQVHTWSGGKFRAAPNSKEKAGGNEWSSASSSMYVQSSSARNTVPDLSSNEGRGGGVPLPLTTTPSAFTEQNKRGSGNLPVHVGDLDEAAVGNLVEKLQHKQPFEQEQAVVEIRRLTRVSAEDRLSLCETEVLEALLPLLQSRYSNVQINAVAAVMNLSLEKENKLKVARAGAIPFLIDVLKGGHFEAQEHAAGAIFSLALNDDNKMAIGVLGAIPPLIHVLRTGKHGARRDAAMALYHLSFSQINRTKLIRAGGVGIFLGIAKDERSDVVSRALLILCNIAAMEEGRVALAEMSAVQVMVGLLTRGDEAGAETSPQEGEEQESRVNWTEVREHAAAALLQLSHHNFRFKSQAVRAGALDGLQRLLEEGTPRAREKATALLTILRDAPGADGSFEDNGSLYRRSYLRTIRGVGPDDKAESAQF